MGDLFVRSGSAQSLKRLRRLPVGEVTLLPIHPIDDVVLERIADALRSRGVRVQLKPSILRPRGAYDPRRRQMRADVLLERVMRCEERPVLGITDADCYAADLNFVFGIAAVGQGAAVVALSRLHARATASSFLERALKEIFHELGHAVGLGHCEDSRCVMHFSNSLADTDVKDEELCPACVRRVRHHARAIERMKPDEADK